MASTSDDGSPGVFQGVRLSRKLPDWGVFQPQVVDEVIKIIAHSHLIEIIHNVCAMLALITLYGVGLRERLWSCLRVFSDLWTCCLISVMVGSGSGIFPLSHTRLYIDSTLCGITYARLLSSNGCLHSTRFPTCKVNSVRETIAPFASCLWRVFPWPLEQIDEGVPVAAVQPERLLLAGHRDLVHVLAQLDLWLVIHRDQLEYATQCWLSLAGYKVGSWNSLIYLAQVRPPSAIHVKTNQFQKL